MGKRMVLFVYAVGVGVREMDEELDLGGWCGGIDGIEVGIGVGSWGKLEIEPMGWVESVDQRCPWHSLGIPRFRIQRGLRGMLGKRPWVGWEGKVGQCLCLQF